MKETTALVELLRHLKPSRMYPLDVRRTPEPDWVPAQTRLDRDPSGPNAWHPDIDTPTWWYPTQAYPEKQVVREPSLAPRGEEVSFCRETLEEMAAGRFYQEPAKRISRMPQAPSRIKNRRDGEFRALAAWITVVPNPPFLPGSPWPQWLRE